jgi:hypothetical protein
MTSRYYLKAQITQGADRDRDNSLCELTGAAKLRIVVVRPAASHDGSASIGN